MNNVPFGKMFQQPACTRWVHIGTVCCQFVHRVEGFRKIALGVTNVEYSQYQRNKVASDVFSLVQEPVMLSMNHFLSVYHNNYWLPNFSSLKMIDSMTKVSEYCSRHLSTRAFIMKKHLDRLKII